MKYVVIMIGAMAGGCANVQSSKIETQSLMPQMSKTTESALAFDPKAQEAANLATRKAYCGNRHVTYQSGVNSEPGKVAKHGADEICSATYSKVEEPRKAD